LQLEEDRRLEKEAREKSAAETGINIEDEFEDDVDTMQFETYESSYQLGMPHPDTLVQAASLASVPVPPITYNLNLPPV